MGLDREMDMDEDDAEGEGDNDVKRLGRSWVKERGTGDIMPWEGDLIDQLFDKLEQQVSSRFTVHRSAFSVHPSPSST
jgi:GINS complex subunit 4